MKFSECVFKMTTNAIAMKNRKSSTDGDTITTVTLLAGEVDDKIVADALTSGQSPRVRYANEWRENGIPDKITLTWSQWLGTPKSSAVVVRPMTSEEAANEAKNNPEFRKQMMIALGLGNGSATNEEISKHADGLRIEEQNKMRAK